MYFISEPNLTRIILNPALTKPRTRPSLEFASVYYLVAHISKALSITDYFHVSGSRSFFVILMGSTFVIKSIKTQSLTINKQNPAKIWTVAEIMFGFYRYLNLCKIQRCGSDVKRFKFNFDSFFQITEFTNFGVNAPLCLQLQDSISAFLSLFWPKFMLKCLSVIKFINRLNESKNCAH